LCSGQFTLASARRALMEGATIRDLVVEALEARNKAIK
jgi:hypothetical protein